MSKCDSRKKFIDDIEVIVGTDLENAYGRTKRASALRSTASKAERLAPMLAGQWVHGGTRYWQRCNDGSWRQAWSHRGGWQGSRLMQIVSALDLEATFESVDFGPSVQRVGIADDFYLVGSAAQQADKWEDL